MANVLIVGGAGYVGGALTDILAGSEHAVRVYDSLVYEESFRKPVDFVFGDVRDRGLLEPQLKWADVVVWLAALVGDGACALDPELTREINADSVRELTRRFDRRIIFASTCSVYGAQDGVLNEASPLNPLSVYASTKLEAEQHLRDADAMIFRLGTLFGVGDCFARIRLDLVVNVLTVKACLHNKITVFGGDQYRPLLHVRDIAAAIAQNLTTTHHGTYNLHSVNVRIRDLAETLLGFFPTLEVQRTEMKFEDSRNYRVSSDLAVRTFGFKPTHSVADGITEIRDLVMSNRLKDVGHARHSNHRYLQELLERSTPSLANPSLH